MDIISLGHASFRIKGKNVSVVTDPFDPEIVGYKFPKHTAADIVTVSHDHPDHNNVTVIEEKPFVATGAGEYEVKGVSIIGVPLFHDDEKGAKRGRNTAYRIKIDHIVFAHMGDVGHKLTAAQLEELDGVDVLFVPCGGHYTIDAKQAAEMVQEIEPKVVIPMHYKREGLNPKLAEVLSPVEDFLKALGVESAPPQPKFVIGKDLPETLQVVVLE